MDRPLPVGKNKKEIGLMKDESGGKQVKKFLGLRAKTYSCLMDEVREIKKNKGTKKCVMKPMLRHQDYKNYVLNNELILKSQQRC